MLSVIFIWDYNFIGSRSTVRGKPSCSSRVREFHCDPTKVHYFLEIGHKNEYTFTCHLPLIQEGFLSVSSESMCKNDCFIPIPYTGPESNESSRIDKYLDSWLKRTEFAKILTKSYSPYSQSQFVGLSGIRLKSFELYKTWPRIPDSKNCAWLVTNS